MMPYFFTYLTERDERERERERERENKQGEVEGDQAPQSTQWEA